MNNVQKLNKLTEKKAGQIFDEVKKQGGEIICDITFPIYGKCVREPTALAVG